MLCRKTVCGLVLVLLAVVLSGCTSLRGLHQREETRERSEMMMMREKVDQVAGRLDDIQTQIDQLWAELRKSRQSDKQASRQVAERLEARLADLEKEIDSLESARAADRKKIIDKMTATVSELVSKRSGGRPSRNISEYGVEHTVKPGETLSEIAAAYGVQMDVLIEANNLQNPDSLRAGHKLFIPE